MAIPLILTDLNSNPFGINAERISFYFVPQNQNFTYITAGTQQFAVANTPAEITPQLPFIPVRLTLQSENTLYVNPNIYIAFFERDGNSIINANAEFEVTQSLTEIQMLLTQANQPII